MAEEDFSEALASSTQSTRSTSSTSSAESAGSFLPSEIGEIPRAPGVYMMFDARRKVLYVGKAVNLRARVRQYFAGPSGDTRLCVPLILQSLHHIETIVTGNEKEAFLLENTLIKRHRPRYNVRLRDDKTYVSVRVDATEEWPRAIVTRERRRDKALYFGPYSNVQAIRQTLNLLQRVFPIRSCTDGVLRNRARPCILHSIGRCSAPCVGLVDKDEYAELVRNTILFLKGRTSDLAERLRARMRAHSENMEYEKAAALRDRVRALESSLESQRVDRHAAGDRDVIGYHSDQGRAAVVLMFYRGGRLVESFNWVLPVYGQPAGEALSEFIGQHYGEDRLVPPELLLPDEPSDRAVIEEWLSELRDGTVRLMVPRRGEKRQAVELANSNARTILERRLSGRVESEAVLADLARRLRMETPPRLIECYDIATLQGEQSAGAKVAFLDGEPHEAGYRLYKIRGVEGVDDFAMMREVLTRRFSRAQREDETLPDLVVVDGGKGQLGVAVQTLADAGLSTVALAALAKGRFAEGEKGEKSEKGGKSEKNEKGEEDDRSTPSTSSTESAQPESRTPERLFLPNRKNPVVFPPRAPSFYLLQRLRDEAHRFVNTYHVRLRRRARIGTTLEKIPGIGPRRAKALLKHFGSLARVREATLDDLASAPGMTSTAALAVFQSLHPETGNGDT
ncbi:excinuclease ABC subunit UvrC [Candidatus Sumerlaeota bacterium]|nr:excinuclease ABC subunit UvrC [Candidatus Sumerlaeota bacterium]